MPRAVFEFHGLLLQNWHDSKLAGSAEAFSPIMSSTKIPPKLLPWFEARKRYRLSHAQTQMARELGLNPKKLGGLDNRRQEPWKMPLPQFIEHCYFERFKVERPAEIPSLEELVSRYETKKRRNGDAKFSELRVRNRHGASMMSLPRRRSSTVRD